MSPPTTRRSISANSMITGIVATTEAPNRCCQSTVYCPMNESSRDGQRHGGVARGQGQRHDELVPGRDEGEDQRRDQAGHRQRQGDPQQRAQRGRCRRPSPPPRSRPGSSEKYALRIQIANARLKPGVDQDQRPHRVDQVEAEELLVDADDQRGRLEHLGDQHEEQEQPAARGTGAGRCSRRRAARPACTRMVAPPATSRLTRRLEVMPKPEPHMLVRFDQAQWCGR